MGHPLLSPASNIDPLDLTPKDPAMHLHRSLGHLPSDVLAFFSDVCVSQGAMPAQRTLHQLMCMSCAATYGGRASNSPCCFDSLRL